MSHVFISYSKKNKIYARELTDKLLELGFKVWIDDRIDFGDEWWSVIVQSIRDCAAFIVIMTPESGQSRWVKREVLLADNLDKPIFPMLLSGDLHSCELWALFIGMQYTDVTDGLLPSDGRFYDRLAFHATRKISSEAEVMPVPSVELESIGVNFTSSTIASDSISSPQPTPPQMMTLPAAVPDVSGILPPPFEWCLIPAGPVTLAESGYMWEVGQTFEVSAFAIAKYPITNAQYRKFVVGQGYMQHQWWTAEGWLMRERKGWTQPRYWTDKKWNGDDYPVVGVSWYVVIAFCRWLTAQLETPYVVSLPMEQQWQRAAQALPDGSDSKHIYPWGNNWDGARCNSSVGKDWQTNQTTPVTQYQGKGDSPCGVIDMSGNVWEWCLISYETGNNSGSGTNVRVMRGGSWYEDFPFSLRVGRREKIIPDHGYDDIGFRVMLSVPV